MERTEIGPYRSRWNASLPSRGAAFWAYLLGPPLVVFAVIAAAFAVSTLEQSLGWVAHTREVREHLNAAVSALLDAETAQRGYLLTRETSYAEQFAAARARIPAELESIRMLTAGSRVGLFIDINPGMDRTGVGQEATNEIIRLAHTIEASGQPFRGLHYYDGHLAKYEMAEREALAHRGYDRLIEIVAALEQAGLGVGEVITAGTPAFPCTMS